MEDNNKPREEWSPEFPEVADLNESEINANADEMDTAAAPIDAEAFELSAEEKMKVDMAELKDKYLRLYADFENFRRRTAKERLDLVSTANADTVKAMLPIIDDFERATQSFDNTTEVQPLKEGVALIYTKLYKTLEAKGLKPMRTMGLPFDAEYQESIAQFPAPSPELKGMVVDEVEKGYMLNDKVIRFAKVVVGV